MTLGQRITLLRKETGLTQAELGEKVGTSGAIISRYENDLNNPSTDMAIKIAQALNVSLDFLATGKDITEAGEQAEHIRLLNTLSEKDLLHVKAVIEAFADKGKKQDGSNQ